MQFLQLDGCIRRADRIMIADVSQNQAECTMNTFVEEKISHVGKALLGGSPNNIGICIPEIYTESSR